MFVLCLYKRIKGLYETLLFNIIVYLIIKLRCCFFIYKKYINKLLITVININGNSDYLFKNYGYYFGDQRYHNP